MKYELIHKGNKAFWGRVVNYLSAFVVAVTMIAIVF